MIMFIEEGGIVRGSKNLRYTEHDVVIHEEGAREEREADAKAKRSTTT
jgi:hypothetical protein